MSDMSAVSAGRASRQATIDDDEWQVRVELAACYRLVALYGWSEIIYNHISARVPGTTDQFLVNPFGLMFEEIRASDLIKVDVDGNLIDDADGWGINPAGFVLHGAVHEGRPDLHCIIHCHSIAGAAVSTSPDGLLPLTLESLIFRHTIAYHDFEGITFDPSEKENLLAHMGEAEIMILRNHGTLACGKTIAAAFQHAFFLEKACQIQLAALSQSVAPKCVPQPLVDKVVEQFKPGFGWEQGRREFDALLRKLDRLDPSFRE